MAWVCFFRRMCCHQGCGELRLADGACLKWTTPCSMQWKTSCSGGIAWKSREQVRIAQREG